MILQAHSLSYSINARPLIKEISLSFETGLLYGLLGPNGSGKTTLMKTISGICQPNTGSVVWNGLNLLTRTRKEISQIISLVPQNPQISFDYSAWDMVAMGLYARKKALDERDRITRALNTVDAWHLRSCPVTQLSQGERQCIYIARALVTESPIVLLDEPTASLDVRHQLQIWEILRNLVSKGKIIIVSLHDLCAAERFCDQIAVLDKGRCVAAGNTRDVLSDERLKQVFGVERSVPVAGPSFSLLINK